MRELSDVIIQISLYKKRLFLAVIGIAVSVWMMTLIFSIRDAFEYGLREYLSLKYAITQNVTCSLKETSYHDVGLNRKDLKVIQENLPNYCDRVVYCIQDCVEGVSLGKVNQNMSLYGVSCGYLESMKMQLINGRFFCEEDYEKNRPIVVISDVVAIACFGTIENSLNSKLCFKGDETWTEFYVVGVYGDKNFKNKNSKDMNNYYSAIYCTDITYDDYNGIHGRKYKNFMISMKDSSKIEEAAKFIKKAIGSYVDTDKCENTVIGVNILDEMKDLFKIILAVFMIFIIIVFIVSGISIMNIMLINVRDRTKEIGIHKALGQKKSSIIKEYLIESIVICLFGEMVGLGCGFFTIYIIRQITKGKMLGLVSNEIRSILGGGVLFVPDGRLIIIVTIYCLVTSVVFGYIPAKKAANMNIIEALRFKV